MAMPFSTYVYNLVQYSFFDCSVVIWDSKALFDVSRAWFLASRSSYGVKFSVLVSATGGHGGGRLSGWMGSFAEDSGDVVMCWESGTFKILDWRVNGDDVGPLTWSMWSDRMLWKWRRRSSVLVRLEISEQEKDRRRVTGQMGQISIHLSLAQSPGRISKTSYILGEKP